jgi:hypothetical protein
VQLLQDGVIEEAPELSHEAAVEAIIILVGCPVDHVEIADDQPSTDVYGAKLAELIQESNLVSIDRGSIN